MKTQTLKVILTILVTISVFIAGTVIAMPILKKKDVSVAKDQTEQIKRSYANEDTSTSETQEITRDYEIKTEETWDISKNGDGSVTAKWTLSDRTLRISGSGEMKDWEELPVGDWHETQYTRIIESIIIKDGVTSVGYGAFYKCNNLTNIIIPNSVTTIGEGSFSECTSLINISIPDSVTTINDGAFYGCTKLISIIIPSSVKSIGEAAFGECSSLTNITISDGVNNIKDGAFYRCSNLTDIVIPSSITSIGEVIFDDCYNLKQIKVDQNNPNYLDENGILYNKEKTQIISYPAGKLEKEFVIPSSVTTIKVEAFYRCEHLENVKIPESITSIEYCAFYRCENLRSIEIPESVKSIENKIISDYTIIYTKADSEAHKYAEKNKKAYILDGDATDISTDYEIKAEETWDISENGDGSVIGKWTLSDKTLRISGNGKMKNWNSNDTNDWHEKNIHMLLKMLL